MSADKYFLWPAVIRGLQGCWQGYRKTVLTCSGIRITMVLATCQTLAKIEELFKMSVNLLGGEQMRYVRLEIEVW